MNPGGYAGLMNARELERLRNELHSRRLSAIHAAALGATASVAALGSLWVSHRLAIVLSLAAAVEAALAAVVFRSRRERIARLALDRTAYALPDVARYGCCCIRQRKQLARWLVEIVAEARIPGNVYLSDRVAHFARELERLASELATSAPIDPVSAVACRRLLTNGVESPLYNPRLPPDELLVALRRIRAGIQTG